MAEDATPQVEARRPLLGLVVLGLCAIAWWFSLTGLARAAHEVDRSGTSQLTWISLGWFLASAVVAATAIQTSGLLVLACDVRGAPARSWAQRWWCWLNHFRLSLVALAASLAISWWLRIELLRWLLPKPPAGAQLNFGPTGPPYLLVLATVAWLPAVPFLAIDVWRLLRPLLDARAARLQIPFAMSSLLVTLATVLFIRHHSVALFEFLVVFEGPGPIGP